MNHLYDTATGRLISSTILDIPTIPTGMSVKVSSLAGIWNETTLDFDPIPVNRIIEKIDFLDLFTPAEMEGIIAKSKESNNAGNKVGVFLEQLNAAANVNLGSSRTINAVNGMETLGLIANGRAAVILNG